MREDIRIVEGTLDQARPGQARFYNHHWESFTPQVSPIS